MVFLETKKDFKDIKKTNTSNKNKEAAKTLN
jgi:hypothetical protein